MVCLFAFLYFPNRKTIFGHPKGKPEPVSIVMPCYNEGKHIGEAIESLLNLNYPKEMIEIIIVDDKSKDDSVNIIKKYTKKYSNVKLIVHSQNSGGAAGPTNTGIKAAKYDYIAVADADSTPNRDALIKMIGFLQQDKKVGGVTCAVYAKKPETFMQSIQATEYRVIAFNRKLLDLVDSVYVTPGPFALYRKKTLIEVGLFDTKNLTQDIEIVWRLLSKGYYARMCLDTHVNSATPKKFRAWWKQRIRWNIGGTQTMMKYRKYIFRKGMLGAFIIPFFSISLFIGLFGLGLFVYLFSRRILLSYLATSYSIAANTTVLSLSELSFSPSILNFFGIVLFFLGLAMVYLALAVTKQGKFDRDKFLNILFYVLVYLAIYPFIMINGMYKLLRGKYSW
jgi:cellulose synthase/poly-beta-1,6-N-acetylglucosamine synthase-like glycosyltransferase